MLLVKENFKSEAINVASIIFFLKKVLLTPIRMFSGLYKNEDTFVAIKFNSFNEKLGLDFMDNNNLREDLKP